MQLRNKVPLESPDRGRISLNAMVTCAQVQFFIGVLLIFFQIPASAITLWQSREKNTTNGTYSFLPISLFSIDCWFPGTLFGLLASICARYQLKQFRNATLQVKNLHANDYRFSRQNLKWPGLLLPRSKAFALLLIAAILTTGFFAVTCLGFFLATQLEQSEPEMPYETRLYLIFFHTLLIAAVIPLTALILVGTGNLTVVSGQCCSWLYPYPVYVDFSDTSKFVGLYGRTYLYSVVQPPVIVNISGHDGAESDSSLETESSGLGSDSADSS